MHGANMKIPKTILTKTKFLFSLSEVGTDRLLDDLNPSNVWNRGETNLCCTSFMCVPHNI